jgi:hypothetical protein
MSIDEENTPYVYIFGRDMLILKYIFVIIHANNGVNKHKIPVLVVVMLPPPTCSSRKYKSRMLTDSLDIWL